MAARTWSTGEVVLVGIGVWLIGLGMGGRIMAQYCVEQGLVGGREATRNRRGLRGARRSYR